MFLARDGHGRKKTAENLATVSAAIEENLRQLVRKLAKNFILPKSSMHELIHRDLGMKSRVIQSRPPLVEATRLRHLEKSRVLLNFLKSLVTSGLI